MYKRQLYDYLKQFDEKKAYNLISFDYLNHIKIRKPQRNFIKKIQPLNKENIFEIIKNEAFKNKYLKEFTGMPTKEIYKKINVLTFDINPITTEEKETVIIFKNIKEKKVKEGFKFEIIN